MNKTRIFSAAMLFVGVMLILIRPFLSFFFAAGSIIENPTLVYFALGGYGLAFALFGLLGLVFTKTVVRCCSVKTSLLALSLSLMGGICASYLLWSFLGYNIKHYPVVSKGVTAVCLIALLLLIALFAVYTVERSKKPSKLGVFIDVSVFFVFLIPFALSFNEFYYFLAYLK